MSKKKASPSTPSEEDLRLVLAFQQEALKGTTDVLAKGVSFYFVILTVIGAYTQSRMEALTSGWRILILVFLCLMTLFVLIAVAFLCWGLYSGLLDLKKTMKRVCQQGGAYGYIEAFLRRGTRVTLVIGILGSLFMLVVFVGLAILLKLELA